VRSADLVIFRDSDSLLNLRERAAVRAWEEGEWLMHSMLDAPEHAPWPVQGGMWGVRGGVLRDVPAMARAWGLWAKKLDDMHFLRHCVFPRLRHSLLIHASVNADEWRAPARPRLPRPRTRAPPARTRAHPRRRQGRVGAFSAARARADARRAASVRGAVRARVSDARGAPRRGDAAGRGSHPAQQRALPRARR